MNRNRNLSKVTRLICVGHLLIALTLSVGCQYKSAFSGSGALSQAAAGSERSETLVLQAGQWNKHDAPVPGTPDGDIQLAKSLFRRENYENAERAFGEVIKEHKDNADAREFALFMKAEAQFHQAKYPKARDSYEELLKEYPGSKHLSAATQRLFTIADKWLEDARADIRRGKPNPFPNRFVQLDRQRKPIFDRDGHAIKLLEFVREREPNGPL